MFLNSLRRGPRAQNNRRVAGRDSGVGGLGWPPGWSPASAAPPGGGQRASGARVALLPWRLGCPARRTWLRSARSVFLGPQVIVCRGDSSMGRPRCEDGLLRGGLEWVGGRQQSDISSSAFLPILPALLDRAQISHCHPYMFARVPDHPVHVCVCEYVGRV